MLSLAFEVLEDESAVAAEHHLRGLAKHLLSLQLQKPQRQSTITLYFQVNAAAEQLFQMAVTPSRLVTGAGMAGIAGAGGVAGAARAARVAGGEARGGGEVP